MQRLLGCAGFAAVGKGHDGGLQKLAGGAEGDRTPDLIIANDALSQLSYSPVPADGLVSVAAV